VSSHLYVIDYEPRIRLYRPRNRGSRKTLCPGWHNRPVCVGHSCPTLLWLILGLDSGSQWMAI